MTQMQPYQQPQPYQTSQVDAQFWQGVISALMALALGAWVISQLVKAFRGEEVEKPF